jgi:hypothetical protein
MTAGRTYGEMDPAFNWSCGFHNNATDPACLAPAVWHGFIISDEDDITGMMACCDRHLEVMKLSADWVHSIDSPCGLPGSRFRWPENECYLPPEMYALVEVAQDVMSR